MVIVSTRISDGDSLPILNQLPNDEDITECKFIVRSIDILLTILFGILHNVLFSFQLRVKALIVLQHRMVRNLIVTLH